MVLHCRASQCPLEPTVKLISVRFQVSGPHMLTAFERMITKRYLWPGKGEGFIKLVALISFGVVTLSVAMLIVVMSVMGGFRADMQAKFSNLNGHAIIQGYGGELENWEGVLEAVRATDGVVDASPLIEQPLFASYRGRGHLIFVRGNTAEDIASLGDNVLMGNMDAITPGSGKVAIGSRLAGNMGARVGDTITIVNPTGRATPFGTSMRQVGYEVGAIFEIGLYDFDETFVIMPIADAQTLLLMGDKIGLIEVNVTDPGAVKTILADVEEALTGRARIADWKEINASLFEALEVERVVVSVVLAIMVLVASFNILSILVMLVRAKSRDIAIMRTMGATRRSLLKIFVTIGTAIGGVGTLAGLALGFAFLFFLNPVIDWLSGTLGIQIWDPSVRFLTSVPFEVNVSEVIGITVLGFGLSFLATLYPAYKAANTDPVQVLRYE